MTNEGTVGYQHLLAWQEADRLALSVYQATKRFPREELYGLTSQLRRAALSVPTNLVEGSSRLGKKELKRFVSMALGSLAEVDYLLGFSNRLGYIENVVHQDLEFKRRHVGKLLWGFYRSL